MKIDLPVDVKHIISVLQENGYECFCVGGCVRDSLSSKPVNDWDFTTNAVPQEIENCFSQYTTIDIGKKFGTICVVINGENYEITTYRTDGEYIDSRHPETVNFSRYLTDDLSRRDFTVNALAYNDEVGIVDEFNGLSDLEMGVIRCIGDADTRFSEDALRILRALRFASTYGYSIEKNTSEAILRNKERLSDIASERIAMELKKLLCGKNVDFILRRYKDVFAVIIPQISGMFNFDQNTKHHNKDLWRHTVSAVKNTPADPILRMTMLLHDIGKPMTVFKDKKGASHFPNHPKLGCAMAKTILTDLRFPNDFISTVTLLIENHDNRLKPEPAIIKRCMRDIGVDNTDRLLSIQKADILAQSSYKRVEKLETLDAVCAEFERIKNTNECYSLDTLAVNGKDIIHLGVTKGEKIGEMLHILLEKVIDSELENKKDTLLDFVKTLI